MPDKVNSIIEDSELKTIGNQELIALLRKIQGNRSLREYSRAAGISPAALSQIMHGEYTPSRATLGKLASTEANPEGEVALEELMNVAGYSQQEGAVRSTRAEMRSAIFRKADLISIGLIYKALITKGIAFEIVTPDQDNIDVLVNLRDGTLRQWGFILWNMIPMSMNGRAGPDIESILFHLKPNELRKISIITNHHTRGRSLMTWRNSISYNGELSFVYWDNQTGRIMSEDYIVHDESRGPELLLIG